MPVTCEEMRRIEESAFARGVSAEDLMEQAGRGIADVVSQFHAYPGTCIVFCGKGNNAGDALVAARHLAARGWAIETRLAYPEADFSPLAAKKFAELHAADAVQSKIENPKFQIVLDGLLGIGASGAPRPEIAEAIHSLNQLRETAGPWVLAVDLPSGLDADTGAAHEACVRADLTAAIAQVKHGLLADAAADHVGRLAVIALPELASGGPENIVLAASPGLRGWLPPRGFDTHKGTYGRVGIVAGSVGLAGAARLCSAAAVRAGAGLVTLYAKPDLYEVLASSCLPEVMVKPVANMREVLQEKADVLAIGPGLGGADSADVLLLVRNTVQPVVVDADALNLLARDLTLLRHCRGPRLLTPHPGEMERLFPARGRGRRQWVEDFLAEYPVNLLLKGSRTIIGRRGAPLYCNSTGNPGMGSGGTGDVLTGVCAGLCAQMGGEKMFEAGVLGAWLCGRAAEVAVFSPGGSPESLAASDILSNLGAAFRDLRAAAY